MFNVNKEVELIDSCMGSFKTTNILNWIDANPNERYIYVSPLLSEVQEGGRIHKSLKNTVFESPSDADTTKGEHFLELLKDGCNIACTHNLYLQMTEEHLNTIALKGYIVVVDEELDVIGGFDKYASSDLEWLLDKGDISISDKDGMVQWVGKTDLLDRKHKYYMFMQYCKSKSIYATKRSSTMMVTQLPIKLFEVAKRTIVMTYLFDGNLLDCFLRLKGFTVKPFVGIETTPVSKAKFRGLITIIPPNEKTVNYSLSASWWKTSSKQQVRDVQNFIETNCRKHGLKGVDVAWTVHSCRVEGTSSQGKLFLKPRGYITCEVDGKKEPCYLGCTVRATNKYKHKKAMFHCFDRYPIQSVTAYLEDYNQPVDKAVFALSEMLQWLWRGCIRDGKPMIVGIASKRMHNLFVKWLNED